MDEEKLETLQLSDQAVESLCLVFLKSLLEQTSAQEMLKEMQFVVTEDGLVIANPFCSLSIPKVPEGSEEPDSETPEV